jgi:hypothetical protein
MFVGSKPSVSVDRSDGNGRKRQNTSEGGKHKRIFKKTMKKYKKSRSIRSRSRGLGRSRSRRRRRSIKKLK